MQWLEEQEFYELMQAYRHAKIWDQAAVVAAFEAVKLAIRGHQQMQDYETNALRKDAERYRFIRDGGGADSVDRAYHNTVTADEFDAWIDGDMGNWRSK